VSLWQRCFGQRVIDEDRAAAELLTNLAAHECGHTIVALALRGPGRIKLVWLSSTRGGLDFHPGIYEGFVGHERAVLLASVAQASGRPGLARRLGAKKISLTQSSETAMPGTEG
jgi:hypothetical protein